MAVLEIVKIPLISIHDFPPIAAAARKVLNRRFVQYHHPHSPRLFALLPHQPRVAMDDLAGRSIRGSRAGLTATIVHFVLKTNIEE